MYCRALSARRDQFLTDLRLDDLSRMAYLHLLTSAATIYARTDSRGQYTDNAARRAANSYTIVFVYYWKQDRRITTQNAHGYIVEYRFSNFNGIVQPMSFKSSGVKGRSDRW